MIVVIEPLLDLQLQVMTSPAAAGDNLAAGAADRADGDLHLRLINGREIRQAPALLSAGAPRPSANSQEPDWARAKAAASADARPGHMSLCMRLHGEALPAKDVSSEIE